MNQSKHICNLEYCKKHSQCIYRNAISSLKSDSYIVAVGSELNSDRILCYEKIVEPKPALAVVSNDNEWREIFSVVLNKSEQPHCENPSCNSVADLKYNGKVNLCFKCLDLLREYKSNHELAKYFKHRYQLIKLLKVTHELENPKEKTVVRCSNIYCGTTDKITQHHLIPNPYRKGIIGGGVKIPLCEPCHKKVHRLRTNKQLALHYNTKSTVIELLSEDVPFRLSRMMAWEELTDTPKREMTMVALNSVPSRMVAVAG